MGAKEWLIFLAIGFVVVYIVSDVRHDIQEKKVVPSWFAPDGTDRPMVVKIFTVEPAESGGIAIGGYIGHDPITIKVTDHFLRSVGMSQKAIDKIRAASGDLEIRMYSGGGGGGIEQDLSTKIVGTILGFDGPGGEGGPGKVFRSTDCGRTWQEVR